MPKDANILCAHGLIILLYLYNVVQKINRLNLNIMSTKILPFDGYQINYYTPGQSGSQLASISLSSQGVPFAVLSFYADGSILPVNSNSGTTATPVLLLAFYKNSFYDILSILWNVKNLNLVFNTKTFDSYITDKAILNVGEQDM